MKFLKWIGLGTAIALSLTVIQLPLGEAQTAPVRPLPIKPDVPYVPTPEPVVNAMLSLASVNRNDVLYDLGSGDGRLVITAAQKFGAKRGVGVEINPGLVNESKANAQKAGVSDRVEFIQQNLFETDLRPASVVTLYLLPKVNLQLRPRLLSQLKPGSRVVSHAFSMGDWKPDRTVLVNDGSRPRMTYLWIIPANVGGTWSGTLSNRSDSFGVAQRAISALPYTVQVDQKFQTVHATLNLGGQTLSVPQVKLTGDRVTLEHSQNLNGQDVRIQFNGQVIGDTLQGTAQVKIGNSTETYTLNGKRTSTAQRS